MNKSICRDKNILIIGNGPSTRELAELGFDNLHPDFDTFGMGIAYRFFREINWWPTWYACGDSKVVFSHREELAKVVEDPRVTTKRFFFSWPITRHPRLELIEHRSTGDFCFRKCLELRYKKIFLIGIEGHYVEEILESRPVLENEYDELGLGQLNLPKNHRKTLRIITQTPEVNPNYFFYGYQQSGDIYSLPQANIHRNRWQDAAVVADSTGADIINLSPTSRISDFPKTTLQHVADQLLCGKSPDLSPAASELLKVGNCHQPATMEPDAQQAVEGSAFWWGPFDRESQKRVDESHVVLDLFQTGPPASSNPVMIDVGACRGGAFRDFASQGWNIHAFEPNPQLYPKLVDNFNDRNIVLNPLAVSNVEGQEIPFYTSEESIGIGSLKPFQPTHQETARVKTVTLDNYLGKQDVKRVEFLKIDTEGFDLMVLQGLDLTRYPVDVILCEFEDRKSIPLGYSTQDMARHLHSHGYTVYVSEWHPIIRYGQRHQWRCLKLYPCELGESAWGNLLAFNSDPGVCAVTRAIAKDIRRFEAKLVKPRKIKTSKTSKTNKSLLGNARKVLREARRSVERPVEKMLRKSFSHGTGKNAKKDLANGRSRKAA